MTAWIKNIFSSRATFLQNQGKTISYDEQGIIKGIVKKTLSNEFHENMPKGAILRELTQNQHHQISWETPYYQKEITNFLQDTDRSKPILDIGCGDGRFTKILVDLGFEKIVCLDSDYRLLSSLNTHAKELGFREKLCIIHTDADELPFNPETFSAILAIGVLYYLNENQKSAIENIYRLLINNGVFILSEPEIEGMMFRTLVFENLNATIEILEDRLFKESQGDSTFKFQIKSKKELQAIIEHSGFSVEDYHGITMFQNILRIMLVRGLVSQSEIEKNYNKLKSLFDFLHEEGSLFKHIIWKCRKI
ncbi:MAG: methyltransferase domain-containing protein [Saprospiraceae bacterium]|nr:methyltransferase domain-containing protein [Saprospiraceae bacterium]